MKSEALLLTLICIFLISVSTSYATNLSDNLTDINSKKDENVSNINNSQKDIEMSPQNNTLNRNIYTENILAAGNNDRPSKLSQSDIINAAHYVDEFFSRHEKLPNYVTISDYKYSIPELMYLLAKTIEYKFTVNDDGTYKMLSTEVLYDSGYRIQGMAV